MKRKGILIGAIVLVAPIAGLLVLALMFILLFSAPGAGGRPGGCVMTAVDVDTPDGGLTVETTTGVAFALEQKQLETAATIVAIGNELGVSPHGQLIAMITVFQESGFWMYANSSVPESLSFPHDRVGSDHDSVNPFQQRANWGTVAERMDLDYATRAFFGGPDGPNGGTPRGLLDITGWEQMTPGKAAQAVQVSAFPDAYDKWVPAGQSLLDAVGGSSAGCVNPGAGAGEAVYPLDQPFNMTDDFGPRPCRVPGANGCASSTWHAGVDLQNWPGPCGQPVYAMLPGEVTLASALIVEVTTDDGIRIRYIHMYKSDHMVVPGDRVDAGQQIGKVGNVQPSSGCHLDLRMNVSGTTNQAVAALEQHEDGDWGNGGGWVNPEDFFAAYGLELCPEDSCKRTIRS